MSQLKAIIVAAGKGTRMESSRSKALHAVCGRPMLSYVVEAARNAGAQDIILVISPDMGEVQELFKDTVYYAFQKEQLGTGHAVLMAESLLRDKTGDVLVLCGDTPLLPGSLLKDLVRSHRERKAAATILTAEVKEPYGYGRIVRCDTGNVERIVEEKDADIALKAITEINTGTYCFDVEKLFTALPKIKDNNAQGEYYLTDVIDIFGTSDQLVEGYLAPEAVLTMGINNRVQLAQAEAVLRSKIKERHMLAGVTIIDPASTFIDEQVTIGRDTVIYPFSIIEGDTAIADGCIIGPSVQIKNSIINANAHVRHAVVEGASVGQDAEVGPFTYLRPGTVMEQDTKAGTFVEMKKAYVGAGSKVPHLSYIGDANLGREVNIGAGTITCNFDGLKKNITDIKDEVFIGSNTNLIAPVTIGRGAYTGAGSTISKDVPADALALGRAEQKNIEGWVERRRQKALLRKKEE